MKRNSFMQGALIATIGIVITKILGVIFVIPFFAIIGEKGGALYSYSYSIYSIFLSLSTIGIPLAISKLTSEYDSLGDYHLKERAFKIAKRLLLILSTVSFLIIVIFAEPIARIFIGNITGGNSIDDIAFTIRMVSTGVLIVPALAVTRGYLQGHKYITPSSISQVIEQIVRIIVLLAGSYVCIYVFHLPMRTAVGVAVFAATVGAIASYLYLIRKIHNNKGQLRLNSDIKREEVKVTNKEIMTKMITYAIPFVISGLVISLYNFADLATIVKGMVNLMHYGVKEAEAVVGIISNWASKIEMIILAVGMGLTTSLLPTITDSYVKNDLEDVRNKINKSLQLLLYVTIPMTVGLNLLATPVWTFFFGFSTLGSFVFGYNVFTTLFSAIMNTLNIIFQSVNENKKMIIYLAIGVATKFILNVPLMYIFHNFGIHASYGASTATIIAFALSCTLILVSLSKRLKVNYEVTLKRLLDILLSTFVMAIIILLLQIIIPIDTHNRVAALLLSLFYALVGSSVYLFITMKNKLFYEIFGRNIINKILIKLKIKKNEVDSNNLTVN